MQAGHELGDCEVTTKQVVRWKARFYNGQLVVLPVTCLVQTTRLKVENPFNNYLYPLTSYKTFLPLDWGTDTREEAMAQLKVLLEDALLRQKEHVAETQRQLDQLA